MMSDLMIAGYTTNTPLNEQVRYFSSPDSQRDNERDSSVLAGQSAVMNRKPYSACDFCRYRKRKCITTIPGNSRCDFCEDIDMECKRSLRKKSEKLKNKSRALARQVLNENDFADGAPTPDTPPARSNISTGRTELEHNRRLSEFHEELVDPFDHRESTASSETVISGQSFDDNVDRDDEAPNYLSPSDMYESLKRFTPFLDEVNLSNQFCVMFIEYAYLLLQNKRKDHPKIYQAIEDLLTKEVAVELETAQVSLLILGRVPIARHIIEEIFDGLTAKHCTGIADMPIHNAAGAILANSWYQYLGISNYPLGHTAMKLDILQRFLGKLEDNSFIRQYVILTRLLLRMEYLKSLSFEDRKDYWLRLEYDFLLVPLHTPHDLLDLRDDIPGTPYGRILHVMVNTINFDFYLTILKDKVLQEGLQLKSVPAVIHFMLAMADTVLRYGREVLDKWHTLSNCQAKMVLLVLELLEISEMDNCKEVLARWRDDYGEFQQLRTHVKQIIGAPPWITEKHFGYSVFWTFRDMRSLHVEGMLSSIEI